MKKLAVALSVLFALAGVCLAQNQTQTPSTRRTITNKDFEQYRKERVSAEREYQKTYSSQGQLSPEEVRAINDARTKELIDLANKIRAEEIERQKAAAMATPPAPQPIVINVRTTPNQNNYPIWTYGYPYPYGVYYPRYYPYPGGVISTNPPLSRGTIYPR